MSIRIFTHDELLPEWEPQIDMISQAALWGYQSFDDIRKRRRIGFPFADYYAVYAVEGDRVLSRVVMLRYDVMTREGRETVAGVSGVVSHPDAARKGLARMLFEDAHRREREAGIRIATLWTNRSWYAHTLYERLGYVDVLDWTRAMKRMPKRIRPAPRGWKLRKATKKDLRLLDSLHSRGSVGRFGWAPRQRGFYVKRGAVGRNRPEEFRVLERRGTPVGYVQYLEQLDQARCFELVAVDDESRLALLDAVEREAHGRWVTLGATFASEEAAELHRRGYGTLRASWLTLMAAPLTGDLRPDELARLLGTDDPRFACHDNDFF